jgi:hypothetical protein
MSNIELTKIILASSVVAGFISAIVSYFTSLRLKSLDFKNEYYKVILKKRINAYEHIERQIGVLKLIVLGDDKKPFHNIFIEGEARFLEYQQNLFFAITSGIWIDEKTSKELDKLNNLFYNLNNHIHNKSKEEMEEIGKEYYSKISGLRISLEDAVKTGLYDLHDMKKAFKINKNRKKRIIYSE